MPTFNQGIRTVAGQNLFGLLNSGKTSIHYTKIVYSSLDLSGKTDDEIAQMTDVQPQELVIPNPSVLFKPKTATTDPETEIRAYGSNQNLSKGFYINTYALYAKGDDGKEILLGVTLDDHPSWLPAYDGVRPQALTYNWDISNKNGTDNVKFTDAHDEYATYGDYQTFSEAVGSQLNSAVDHASSYAGNANTLSGSVSINSSNIGSLTISFNSASHTNSMAMSLMNGVETYNESSIDTMYQNIQSNSADITTMKGKLSDVANNTSVSTAISNVSNATNSLSGSVSFNSSNIANISSKLSDNTSVSTAINNVSNTTNTLSSIISGNSSNIGSLSNEVGSVANNDVPSLSSFVDYENNNINNFSFLLYGTNGKNLRPSANNTIDVPSLSTPDGDALYGYYLSQNGNITFQGLPDGMNNSDTILLLGFDDVGILIDLTMSLTYLITVDSNNNNPISMVPIINLDGYVKQSDLDNDLSNVVTNDSLSSYETQAAADNKLSHYVKKSDLATRLVPHTNIDMNSISDGTYNGTGVNISHGPIDMSADDVQIYIHATDGAFQEQKIIDYSRNNIYIRDYLPDTPQNADGMNWWYVFTGTQIKPNS